MESTTSLQKQFNNNPYNEKQRTSSWITRTFSRMDKGSLRGNILLLIITTMGSSFFYLPYCAKKIGFIATLALLSISALVSYYSSKILYVGFKNTSALTYDECMAKILGQRVGLFSNFIVFTHIFGIILSSWLFSFKFITGGLIEVGFLELGTKQYDHYVYAFFIITFLIIFFTTMIKSIERLHFVSMVGIVILFYIVSILIYLTPEYFNYYQKRGQIHVKNVTWTWEILGVYGITQYVFLNQYTIMSICNNLKNASFRRSTKLITRAIAILMGLYILVLFCGYLSEPDVPTNELFLLRESLPNKNDMAIVIGRFGFGFTLLIAVCIKSHFLLIYYHQLVKRTLMYRKHAIKKPEFFHENVYFTEEEKQKLVETNDNNILEISKTEKSLIDVEKSLEDDLKGYLNSP